MAVTLAKPDTFEERVTSLSPFDPQLAVGAEFEGKRVARKATMSVVEFDNDPGSYILTEYDPMPETPYEPHQIPAGYALMIQLELEVEGIENKITQRLMEQRNAQRRLS